MQRFSRNAFQLVKRPNTSNQFSRVSRKFSTSQPAITQWSEEEIELRNAVAKFAKESIAPLVKKMDETSELDKGVLKAMFDNGFMGVEIPAEYEGSNMSFVSACIVIEELAKVDPAVSVVCDVQNTLVNNVIKKYGSPDIQKQYLPQLSTKVLGSFCLSEWSSGSDAFALKTRADLQGDYYILNGTKAWITNSKEAGLYIVMANTDFSKGYKGITAFLVERNNPGLQVGKKEDKLGIRASSTCEVNLVDCKVHKSHVVGEVGKGYKIAIEGLNEGRIGIASQMLGLAQGAFDSTIPYLKQRQQFGKPLSSFQGMQFDIAELATDIEAARLLTYNAARLKDAGKPFVKESAMAKLFASQVAEKVASRCVNMLGGVGFTKEFPAEKYFRDCKIGQIYEGTSNIQLQTIAKLVTNEYA